jgi:hypothetical protein
MKVLISKYELRAIEERWPNFEECPDYVEVSPANYYAGWPAIAPRPKTNARKLKSSKSKRSSKH